MRIEMSFAMLEVSCDLEEYKCENERAIHKHLKILFLGTDLCKGDFSAGYGNEQGYILVKGSTSLLIRRH